MNSLMKHYLIAALTFLGTASGAWAQTQQSGLVLPVKQVTVQSPVQQTELITEMRVKEGDQVKKGVLLVQLRNERETLDVNLKENAPVQVMIEKLNNTAFSGKINFIDPRNDAASGLVQVLVEIDNPEHKISPGMKALADFGK